jgi:hypothetical protein
MQAVGLILLIITRNESKRDVHVLQLNPARGKHGL